MFTESAFDSNVMLQEFWAVRTTDNEYNGSIKAYFIHRENAVKWLATHYDWWASVPCEPDDYHLIRIVPKDAGEIICEDAE